VGLLFPNPKCERDAPRPSTREKTMKYMLGLVMIGLLAVPIGWAQTQNSTEKELIGVENAWKQAVVKRDVSALQHLYADEYMSVDQEGMTWNKKEDIEIDTAGVSRLSTYKLEDLTVRIYGDVAVVTGRNSATGKVLDREAKAQNRFTDVFVKRDGRWQCVHSQTTPIVG
jgi:ketosteroid isomerase-like protein